MKCFWFEFYFNYVLFVCSVCLILEAYLSNTIACGPYVTFL